MQNELVIELNEDVLDVSVEQEEKIDIEIQNSDMIPTGTTSDYSKLVNKPQIEGVELINNRTFKDLGLSSLTNSELENLLI